MLGSMMRRAMLGDGSTLSLDFTAMSTTADLTARGLTFTRASTTATYINSSGYVTTAGTNVARFDYDPTTLAPRGLLVEGQSVNIVKYSQELNQVSGVNQWYATSFNTPTVPASPPTDPFGGTSASWKLVATAGSAFHLWRFSAAFTAENYTFSFWAKAAEYDRITLGDPGSGRGGCSFVLTGNGSTVVRAGTVTPTNPRITPYENGWYRCEVTMLMTAATYGLGIGGYPSATTPSEYGPNYNADGTSGVYATGFQAELGSGASSYIPTGASQGTRNQDVCYMDTAQVNSWFIKNNEATFQVRYSCDNALSANTNVFYLGQWGAEYSYGYQHYTYAGSGGTLSGNGKLVSATSADNGIYANQSLPRVFNTAFSFSTSASLIANSWNGNTPSQLSATSWPTWPSTTIRLGIGTNAASGTSSSAGFMRIQSLKYWPTRLPNAQLQSLTT